jgi:hypothetical protein
MRRWKQECECNMRMWVGVWKFSYLGKTEAAGGSCELSRHGGGDKSVCVLHACLCICVFVCVCLRVCVKESVRV